MNLNIITRNIEDSLQIVEQIAPYFKPTFTVTTNSASSVLGQHTDIVFELMGGSPQYENEGSYDTSSFYIYTFNFNVQVSYYGPKTSKGVIRRVIIDTKFGDIEDDPDGYRYTVELDPFDAEITEDYDFSETYVSPIPS